MLHEWCRLGGCGVHVHVYLLYHRQGVGRSASWVLLVCRVALLCYMLHVVPARAGACWRHHSVLPLHAGLCVAGCAATEEQAPVRPACVWELPTQLDQCG